MSQSHLFMAARFPRGPFASGFGRYVCQVKRMVFKYCKEYAGSRGLRDFLEHDLVPFARDHPSIVVYVKPRRHRSAIVTAEYMTGDPQWFSVDRLERDEIRRWIETFTQQKDGGEHRLIKLIHTDYPSIQGPWAPYTHKDPRLNAVTFPDVEQSKPVFFPKSATERVLELFEQQKIASFTKS